MSRAIYLCVILLLASDAFAAIQNKGWWKNAVFYQVYPRSFMDSNNDGIGDLKGITSKLQHFVDCKIDGIWLSPIYASPMVDFGYDISDFKDIHSDYGTMQDLEDLITKAKELGIKVIMDLVPNHTSDQHEWFQKSLNEIGKYKDYYIWKIGRNNNQSPPNNWISVFSGPAWNFTDTRNQWYFHQFEYRQPDLNYSNPEVRDEMEDVIKFWLRKGIDGFRVDAIPHVFEDANFPDEPRSNEPGATERDYTYLNHIYTKDDLRTYQLVQSWRKLLDDYADYHNEDEKIMMTEAYTNLENTTKYYKYGAHVPFNFKFITDVNNVSTAADFKRTIDDWMSHTRKNIDVPNWVMGNHDRSRTASRYPGRGDQMTMLEMILPGIAVTYNGEEIGMVDKRDISWEDTKDPQACNAGKDKYQEASRDPNRTPFQWDDTINAGFNKGNKTWLPVHENYKELNLKNQIMANESHYKIYTYLTNMRRHNEALRQGSLKTLVQNNGKVLTVIRSVNEGNAKNVVLLINFANEIEQVDLKSNQELPSKLVVELATIGSSVKAGTEMNVKEIKLPANAALVLSG